MTPIIRLASLQDIDSIAEIDRRAFDPAKYTPIRKSQFKHLLTKGHADILIAEHGGKVVGTALIFYKANSRLGRLYTIAIDPVYQGLMYGKALFDAFELRLKQLGYIGALSEIRADQTKYYDYYLREGYVRIKILKSYFPDGCDGFKMKKLFYTPPAEFVQENRIFVCPVLHDIPAVTLQAVSDIRPHEIPGFPSGTQSAEL